MAGPAIDATAINQAILQDSNWVGGFLQQLQKRNIQWAITCNTTAQLAGYGVVTAQDQLEIIRVINDLAAIQNFIYTTLDSSGRTIVTDMAAVQGVTW